MAERIYIQTFPWEMQVDDSIPATRFGQGTNFPVNFGLVQTQQIYWATRQFRIVGVLSGAKGPTLPNVNIEAIGLSRASHPFNLIVPTGGSVFQSRIQGGFRGEASFTLTPAGAGPKHDFREQYLSLHVSGGLVPELSSDYAAVFFSSDSNFASDTIEAGACFFEGREIKLYAQIPSGQSFVAILDVERIPFTP